MVFDAIFVIYILVNIFLGFRYGLFRRFIHVGAFFLGMLLAQALSPGFAEQFGYNTSTHPADAHFAVFLAILFGLMVVAEALGFAYADALGFLNTLIGDRFFGAILGVAAAILEISVLLYLFGQLNQTTLPGGTGHAEIITQSADQVSSSLLAGPIKRLQPVALFLFQPVLPAEPATYFAKTYS